VYAEDYPGGCKNQDLGYFAARHVPFLSFQNVTGNSARCAAHIFDATGFARDAAQRRLPQLVFYIPNDRNNGHDTGVAFADAALRERFEPLINDPVFMNETLLVFVFDEAADRPPATPTNIVDCTFVGAGVQPGFVSDVDYDHYSLLRTIERIFKLRSLGTGDATAKSIDDIWLAR
jgi:acid phosphatase